MHRKNQTSQKHIRMVRKFNDESFGIGKFLYAKQPQNLLSVKLIQGISYREAKQIGEVCVAFKFIPYGATIVVGKKQYRITGLESMPKKKWRCNGHCDEICHEDECCLCVMHECF